MGKPSRKTTRKESDIRVKVTSELKEQFTLVLDQIGLSPSVAMGMFARQVVLCQGLPFTPQIVNRPNQETLEAIADIENNRHLTPHESAQAMFDSWDSELH
jgi:addiction module RelB/DinJ family antitoxin